GDAQPTDNYPDPKVGLPGIWQVDSSGKVKTVRSRDVTDGLSKTYLAGEKTIPATAYETGKAWGDMGTIYTCPFGDCVRFAEEPPSGDVVGAYTNNQSCVACHSFGAAHPATWNAAFCDGSVRSFTYTMSFNTHRAMASRAGGDSTNPREN